MNEHRCVLRSAGGDEEAFALLVMRYHSPIRNFINSLVGDFHHSQDLAQETFLKAFRSLSRLESPDKFRRFVAHVFYSLEKEHPDKVFQFGRHLNSELYERGLAKLY